jgi:UDP-N-acetylglucosamine--N-acetylmuramyl-(pentapeptide) pyrophosphoryl-undecaprenol N-acetylglucosamine transferase
VLLAGGGSGGSATPVLAVAQALRRRVPSVEFLYVGTRDGPEAALAASQHIPFAGVHAGKLRRYWDARNLVDPFQVCVGISESMLHVRRFKPAVAFGAGGFGAVPPIVAARLAGAATLIHQQDVEPGLANRLLAPFAERITVSLEASVAAFPGRRTQVTGNPVREEILSADASLAFARWGLLPEVPLVVVTGGGTGALTLNQLVSAAIPKLVGTAQVVHLTGRGRGVPQPFRLERYTQVEFVVEEMPHLLAAATLVVSRAGMGTLSELAALAKATLIVPLPGSHQRANAHAFARLGAVDVADQAALSPESLAQRILNLLADGARRKQLGAALSRSMPHDAAERVAALLVEMG